MKKLSKIFRKLTKKTILAILAILVIGIPLLYLTVLNQREAKASWPARQRLSVAMAGGMDENWLYNDKLLLI